MNGFLQDDSESALAMEQKSWARQIERCLLSVSQGALADDGGAGNSAEAWQLIERSLRLGADVLRSLPQGAD